MHTPPFLGFGLGLRTQHFEDVLRGDIDVDWFEVLSENFMVSGGKPRYYLDAVKERYPLVMHGVSLSIGSSDPLDQDYLKSLKALVDHVDPPWFSDHICWTSHNQINSHDLLPLPYTQEAVQHVVERVKTVQDFVGKPMLLENVSSYLSFEDSQMTEWEFLNTVAREANCYLLFDVNNIYVSARNHGFEPLDYIHGIDPDRVWQMHLAGHSDFGTYVIDTHDHEICSEVWELYGSALKHFGLTSSMIERDDNIPPLPELVEELALARSVAAEIFPDDDRLHRNEIAPQADTQP